MIVRNERDILEKTLNYKALDFDLKLAVDFMSDDFSVELLGSYGFQLIRQEWKNNYAHARNILIQYAEEQGADYLFMLDADEAMFSTDLEALKRLAEQYDAIALPRIEFVKDFGHYDPTLYPDYQCRFFRLNKGYHFKNRVHEMLHTEKGEAVLAVPRLHFRSIQTPIYHYSRVKEHSKLALKYINYDRMVKNEPPLTELPAGYDPNAEYWASCEPFTNNHPLKYYALH